MHLSQLARGRGHVHHTDPSARYFPITLVLHLHHTILVCLNPLQDPRINRKSTSNKIIVISFVVSAMKKSTGGSGKTCIVWRAKDTFMWKWHLIGDLKDEYYLGAFRQEKRVQMTYARKEFRIDQILNNSWCGWMLMSKREGFKDEARGEDRVQTFAATWRILDLRLLILGWCPSLGSSKSRPWGKDWVQNVYLGSNAGSLVKVEDKVARQANKRVTTERCGQLGLKAGGDPLGDCMKHASELCHWGREAGHASTNSHPALFERCFAVLTPSMYVKWGGAYGQRMSSSYAGRCPMYGWNEQPILACPGIPWF